MLVPVQFNTLDSKVLGELRASRATDKDDADFLVQGADLTLRIPLNSVTHRAVLYDPACQEMIVSHGNTDRKYDISLKTLIRDSQIEIAGTFK